MRVLSSQINRKKLRSVYFLALLNNESWARSTAVLRLIPGPSRRTTSCRCGLLSRRHPTAAFSLRSSFIDNATTSTRSNRPPFNATRHDRDPRHIHAHRATTVNEFRRESTLSSSPLSLRADTEIASLISFRIGSFFCMPLPDHHHSAHR